MNALTLTPGSLTLKQLRNVWRQPVTLSLDESAHAAINDSVACVEAIVVPDNCGFWSFIRPDREGLVIPWNRIRRIGDDVILVELDEKCAMGCN